ncbi:MAG TPA: malectin domain-containing carbohydrate-binding protein [Trebonia sp.]|nr:malectin domain-containing carbohydrate-binding protein [Trebonia sp.]
MLLLAFALALIGLEAGSGGFAAKAFADAPSAQGASIDAGGSGDGAAFAADEYYSGGSAGTNSSGSNGFTTFSTVASPIPQADWNTYRSGSFTYQVPGLSVGGEYQVRLYFLDWQNTQVGQRVFDADINGTPVLENFDIVQAAGNAGGDGTYIGVEENFNETADASGDITIQLLPGSAGVPLVNAIALTPVAVNASGVSVDSGGSGDGGSVNVAGAPLAETGWVATSSTSSAPGDAPQNAISGNTGARYSSDADQAFGMWWQVDMGSARSFDEISLDSGGFNQDYARAYQVQVSNNGTTFTSIYNGTGTGSPETANFAPQTARYIRVVLEVGVRTNWWSLVNVLVYGSGSAASGFVADEYYSGGSAGTNTSGSNGFITFARTVAHPIPQNDWNTYRTLPSTYVIPDLTPAAGYQVRLYFLDWQHTQVGQRVFNVDISSTAVLQNFDIVQAAGNAGGDGTYIGVEEDFSETADASGDITIQFLQGSAAQPIINAIAVVPTA